MDLKTIVSMNDEDLVEFKEELESQLFYVNNEIKLREMARSVPSIYTDTPLAEEYYGG